MADEEAFFVVVGVDEPAGDAFGTVAADFAGVGVEYVHTVYLDSHLAAFGFENVDVRLAEDDEEVAFADILEVVGHVQVCVHARIEHGDTTQLIELRGMRVVVKGASDEHIEIGITGLSCRRNQIRAGNDAEFRAVENWAIEECVCHIVVIDAILL